MSGEGDMEDARWPIADGRSAVGDFVRGGFTLIELLVVMAIVMVLGSILLPVLTQGKESAKRMQCVSSLRQLGMASQMYWHDHEGFAYRYREGETNNGDIYWFGWLERGSEGEREFDATHGALYPYVENASLAICPSLNYASSHFKLKAKGAAYGYGYNTNLSSAIGHVPVLVSEIAHPSGTVLLADAAQVNIFQYPASPDHPMLEEFYYVNELEATAHFRHGETANAVFCDGHVGRERAVAGSIDEWLPSEHVGRLRPGVLRIR